MTMCAARSVAALAAAAIAGLAASPAVAGTVSTEPPAASVSTAPGCAEIGALLDTTVALGTAVAEQDAAALEAAVGDFSASAEAAAAAAPDEISDDVHNASVAD